MTELSQIATITVKELSERLQQGDKPYLLDVREPQEVAICQLPESVHIPMNLIPNYLDQIPDDMDIIIYCHHGMRSLSVALYLLEAGFDPQRLFNLDGGIEKWAEEIEPSMLRY